MAKFVKIPLKKVDVESVNRFQQNVSLKFDELDQDVPLPVQTVTSSSQSTQYLVKNTDEFIIVDSRGGPMKIVLTPPFGRSQSITVKNANTGKVTVVQADGKANGDGATSIDIPAGKSLQLVDNGKNWYSLGA